MNTFFAFRVLLKCFYLYRSQVPSTSSSLYFKRVEAQTVHGEKWFACEFSALMFRYVRKKNHIIQYIIESVMMLSLLLWFDTNRDTKNVVDKWQRNCDIIPHYFPITQLDSSPNLLKRSLHNIAKWMNWLWRWWKKLKPETSDVNQFAFSFSLDHEASSCEVFFHMSHLPKNYYYFFNCAVSEQFFCLRENKFWSKDD